MEREIDVLKGHCNGCANHCPLSSMQCGRGLKLMKLDQQIEQQMLKRQKNTQDILDVQEIQRKTTQRQDIHKPNSSANLASLFKACNNKLFIHGGNEEFFDVLSDDERENLKVYLERLIND